MSPGFFAGGRAGRGGSRRGGDGLFLQSQHARILSDLRVPCTDGLNCPGCGGTRALYALLHGNVRLALKDNALLLVTLASLAVWGGRLAIQKLRNQPVRCEISPRVLMDFCCWPLFRGFAKLAGI